MFRSFLPDPGPHSSGRIAREQCERSSNGSREGCGVPPVAQGDGGALRAPHLGVRGVGITVPAQERAEFAFGLRKESRHGVPNLDITRGY